MTWAWRIGLLEHGRNTAGTRGPTARHPWSSGGRLRRAAAEQLAKGAPGLPKAGFADTTGERVDPCEFVLVSAIARRQQEQRVAVVGDEGRKKDAATDREGR